MPAEERQDQLETPPESPSAGTTPPGVSPSSEPLAEDFAARLAEAEKKAAEERDAHLRALAEVENVRKRAADDVAKAHRFANERFAGDLLAVKDSLEAALAAENSTIENLRSGVELTLRQLEAVFERQHLKAIDPVGERFDPHRHQAISMLPSDKEPNTVINVLQKGYALHDRVIRPALVTVAKAKDA